MPITPEARVEHTAELGCAIAGIFDFLRLRGDGIVARLLDRNRTEPIPAEPSESARRCIGRSGDLREPSPERRMAGDRSPRDRLSRAAKSPTGYLRSTSGKRWCANRRSAMRL